YWPKVHDELRKKGYAGNVEVEDSSIQLHFGPEVPQTETRNRTWTVFTPDRQHAYSFNDGGIFSFHTSDYTTRTDLSVGVRMLELVRPSDTGQHFADYLQPSLMGFLGLPHIDGEWSHQTTSLHQRFADGDAEVAARFDCLPTNFGIQFE